MVLLLARLAHHLLLWGKQWLSRVPATRQRLRGYGLVRLLRDVWAVPGGDPVATRLDGQCALLTPAPADNSAPGKLFRPLSRACAGGLFALKVGSWACGCRRGLSGSTGPGAWTTIEGNACPPSAGGDGGP